jgi:hypothetical protein
MSALPSNPTSVVASSKEPSKEEEEEEEEKRKMEKKSKCPVFIPRSHSSLPCLSSDVPSS